jgi:hypothetical protein
MVTINKEIAEALERQRERPLEVRDAAGRIYYLMTEEQFRQYVYDDSELSADEMLAAAMTSLNDADDWDAPEGAASIPDEVGRTS